MPRRAKIFEIPSFINLGIKKAHGNRKNEKFAKGLTAAGEPIYLKSMFNPVF